MISAIIVNYRTESYVRELLGSLDRERLVAEIIVVDNSPGILAFDPEARTNKKLELISNRENVGLARAVNQAAEVASCTDLLLINPDVRPLENSIAILYESAKQWSAPIAGPRFYWDDSKIFRLPPAEGASLLWQSALAAAADHPVDERLASFYWQIRFDRFWSAREPIFEPFLGGACLLVNTQKLARQNFFDERFFLYYEETDLCFEILMSGAKILCVPRAEMIHHWGMSPAPSKSKPDLRAESARIFMEKHYPGISIPAISRKAGQGDTIEERKNFDPPIRFPVPSVSDTALYCEIGVNPLFIPFAQAKVSPGEAFIMPEEIWSRMEEREYYARIRGALSGTLKTWKFRKGL